MTNYLGQSIPTPANQGISNETIQQIKTAIERDGGLQGRRVEVFVSSKKTLKIEPARVAVVEWLKALFHQTVEARAEGFGVSSGIDEQPHGLEHTREGAANRLKNLKVELLQNNGVSHETKDGVLRVLVSLENGIMEESVPQLKNAETFQTESGTVWVDRCLEVTEIWFQGTSWTLEAVSEGVTTPRAEVEASQQTNWSETAGSFIAKKYGWPSTDWHGAIAGKGRQIILEELVKSAFGLPYSLPIPQRTRSFDPSNFLHYNSQAVDFFTPQEIDRMLEKEIEGLKQGKELNDVEDSAMWRSYYSQIPQPIKGGKRIKGPDGDVLNTTGPVLTEDLLVGYFDTVVDPRTREKKDVLHIVLHLAEEGGWVLPGKRDRAYEQAGSDISVQDANYSLVEKEIKLDRSHVVANVVLGCFDDRKREQRMKTTSMISFALLDQKPTLVPGKKVGFP